MPDENQNPAEGVGETQVTQPETAAPEAAPEAAPKVITPAPEPAADDGETAAKGKGGRGKKVAVVVEATGAAGLIKFLSRVPHQIIDLGDQKVEFQGGEALVSEDVANRLRGHHLFSHNHIFDGRNTVRLGTDFVDLDKESPAVRDALKNPQKDDVAIYAFTENPNIRIGLGEDYVQFHMGKAVVTDPKLAARLERHMFYAQGRMTKLAL